MAEKYISSEISPEWLDDMKDRKVLLEGEELEFAIKCSIEKAIDVMAGQRGKLDSLDLASKMLKMDKRKGIAAITNNRIIFYMPKMLDRYEFESFDHERMDSVEFTKGMRKSRLEITTLNDHKILKDVNTEEGKKMTDELQKIIVANKDAKSNPTTVNTVQQQSPMDLLKTKFINGEITDEEYQQKHKILEDS